MKTRQLSTLTLLLALFLTAISSGCTKESEPAYFYGPCYDFANIESYTSDEIYFTAFAPNSDLSGTLMGTWESISAPEKYPVGTRVLITYNVTSAITSPDPSVSAIQLTDIAAADVVIPKEADPDSCTVGSEKATLVMQPYRGGNFINFMIRLPKANDREFICNYDMTASDADPVQLYLTSKIRANTQTDEETSVALYPVSIDISSIRETAGNKGLIVNLAVDEGSSAFNFSF
ncbi:MAG: hypothetical protein K2G01_06025 [Paramuribaculum sp.]|nr:hypothetical protein [Paramuribaculum sp.]